MTRRQILQQALFVPLVARAGPSAGPATTLQLISEPNCLSEESAEGFRSLRLPPNVILLCGISTLDSARALQLRAQAFAGHWIVFETSPRCTLKLRQALHDVFGIALREPVTPLSDRLYVRYSWPHSVMTRSFSGLIPVASSRTEAIAHYAGLPVAMKRTLGSGGVLLLGSMLGPNMRAEEPQSKQLVTAIFSRITSACTSTTTSTNT